MNLTQISKSYWLMTPILAASLSGAVSCATEVADDDVTSTKLALTTAECGRWQEEPNDANNVHPDAHFWGPGYLGPAAVNLPIITPTTYSNPKCSKGFVVGGMILDSDTTLNTGGGPTAKVTVAWNDVLPTNKTDCNNTYMMGIVYDFTIRTPKHGYTAIGVQTSRGVWVGFPIGRCVVPTMVFDSATYLQSLEPGYLGDADHPANEYQFSITGRTPTGATRSLRLDYFPPQIIN